MEVSETDHLISELNYFPPVSWFFMIREAGDITFDVYEHYQKRSWRNRCYISGPNGIQLLSVPLERGKNERRPFRDVRISNAHRWQQEHWRSLCACYRRSAWFEFFEDDLAPYFEKQYEFLLDWNLDLLEFVFRPLDLNPSLHLSEAFIPYHSRPGDIRAQSLYDESHQKIAESILPYQQVFSDRFPFHPNLSIVDRLFNLGKSTL